MSTNNIIIIAVIAVIVIGLIIFFTMHKSNKLNEIEQGIPAINGLQIEVLRQGSGPIIKNGDQATVHYVGTLTNGTKFDSSRDRGTPYQFILGAGKVIQGWDYGVLGMKIGEKRKLTIAPELGYGSNPVGPILANSTLIFEVELLKIN